MYSGALCRLVLAVAARADDSLCVSVPLSVVTATAATAKKSEFSGTIWQY